MTAELEIKHAIAKLELIEEQLAELVNEGLATPLERVCAATIPAQLEILRDAVERFDSACCDKHGLQGSWPAQTLASAVNDGFNA